MAVEAIEYLFSRRLRRVRGTPFPFSSGDPDLEGIGEGEFVLIDESGFVLTDDDGNVLLGE